MLFVVKSLFFFFLFTQYPKQMLTHFNNVLNVPHVKERKDQNIKLMLVSSVSVRSQTIGVPFIVGN